MPIRTARPWVPVIGMVLMLSAGCGIRGQSRPPSPGVVPPSHVEVAEMAAACALDDAGIPSGDGSSALCRTGPESRQGEVVSPVAMEFFLARQYRLVERGSDIPVISVTVDTLAVTMAREKSGLVRRTAEAGLTVTISGSRGRSVYRGTGTIEDMFASDMVRTLDESEPFVGNRIPDGPWMRRAQPVLIAVTMTILGWMLYSYRG